uniref:Uncharacterized protein n=1 Tax=Anguilla anguilla TaxID=7936 RepID=A0A0E9TL47_ANGAN
MSYFNVSSRHFSFLSHPLVMTVKRMCLAGVLLSA